MLYQFVLLHLFALPWPYFPSPPFSALVTRMIIFAQILDLKNSIDPLINFSCSFLRPINSFLQVTIPHLDSVTLNLARSVKLRSSTLKLRLLALLSHIPFKHELVSIFLHLKTPRRPHDRPHWRRQVHFNSHSLAQRASNLATFSASDSPGTCTRKRSDSTASAPYSLMCLVVLSPATQKPCSPLENSLGFVERL